MTTGTPGTGAFAASAPMRSEFDDVEAGFDKMPLLTAGTAVVVNGAGTALANTVGRLALAGNFTTTGNFAVVLAASAAVTLTLPALDGTLATLAGAETFSNKTFGSGNNMGTPTALVGTNITGTAAGLTAGNATTAAHATTADSATTATTATTVTTNANLTGVITSVGNATSIASQTGTGTKFVVDTSPTLVTPNIGTPSAGVLTFATGLPISSGVSGLGTGVATALAVNIGTAGAVVTFNGAGGTPSSMTATNLTGTAAGLTAGTASAVAVGGITGLGTGVATALAVNVGSAGSPLVNGGVLGTPSSGTGTNITGVNAATLGGATFAAPGAIGGGTSGSGAFTTLAASGALTYGGVALANSVTGTGSMVLSISPALTGTPTAPTAVASTNTSQIATTAMVQAALGGTGTSWTVTDQSGAGLVLTGVSANYVQIGNMVHAYFQFTMPATGDTSLNAWSLPIAVANANYANVAFMMQSNNGSAALYGVVVKNTSTFQIWNLTAGRFQNNTIAGTTFSALAIYPAA